MKKVLALMVIITAISTALLFSAWQMAEAKDNLKPGEKLRTGQVLNSPNYQYMLIMQDDGNLVIYQMRGIWNTRTQNTGAERLDFQSDGNLVIYKGNNQPVWDAGTVRQGRLAHGKFELKMQNDGNLVIYLDKQPI